MSRDTEYDHPFISRKLEHEWQPLNERIDNDDRPEIRGTLKEKKYEEVSTDPGVPYWRLYQFATPLDWIYIIIATIFTTIIGAGQTYFCILFGFVTGDFVTYVTKEENGNTTREGHQHASDILFSQTYTFAMMCTAIGLTTLICQYIAGVLYSYSSLRQVFEIRRKFFEQTLNQDISWYDLNKTGDFATTFSDNLGKIEEGIGEKVGTFVYFESTFLTGIIWSFVLGWELSLVCFASLPLSIIAMAVITWLTSKFSKQESASYAEAGSIAEETFSSIRTVVAFDGQKKEMERYDKHLIDAKQHNIKRSLFDGISNGFQWFLIYACSAASLWFGVELIIEQKDLPPEARQYTAGTVIAIFVNSVMASWNFSMGAPYLQIFGVACGAASKVFKLLDSEPVINLSMKKGKEPSDIKGAICFSDVYFQYPSRPGVKILNGLSLKIRAGETVAFVGSSGCGKSTCIQMIQRFYDPVHGEITLDGNDIKDMNLTWLRKKIGVVGQEPALFATTIAENIRYGKLSASQEEIERAAKKAQVHKFIKSLPKGYESPVGERGARLSGGQKQRIAIARALIRNPSILLLDEATSALDITCEAEVQAALDSLNGECTTIIVAHRLSTVRNANRIFVFSEGRVVEQGTYQDLIEKQGEFYNLVKSQEMINPNETSTETIEITKSTLKPVIQKEASVVDNNKFKHEKNISDDDEAGAEKTNVLKLLKMNKPEWVWIFLGCIASILIGASLPVYSIIYGDIIGVLSIINEDSQSTSANYICLLFVIFGIVTGVSYLIQILAFGIAGENLTFRLRSKVFAAMLSQEMGWFDRKENGVGALCSKLSTDAAAVQGASGLPIGTALNSIATIVLANSLALYFQWKLALVLIIFFPLIFISIYFETKFMQDDGFRAKKLENAASIAVEAIGNIRTVVSFGCEKLFLERYTESLEPYINYSKRKSHSRSIINGIARSMMYFSYAVGLIYSARLIVYDGVDYASLFKVAELIITCSWALGNSFAFAPDFQTALQASGRIFALLKRVPAVKTIPNASKREWKVGDIEYSDVHFSYPTRPDLPVLRGLDLMIPAGKTVALVGSSGCGKSTIIQQLERFYDPTFGEVNVDDVDIKIMDLQYLRSNFGIVSQEPNLFDLTIAENIAYGNNREVVPMDKIIEAAKNANIHNFVTSLPKGYDTPLGSKGAQLSGGQKQRIAIARALVRNPRILLLDEATSALDNESEKVVQEALNKAKEGRTCITIAHRLATIQDADIICVLDKGKVVEKGNHLELIEKRGHYYDFYKLQSNQS